MNNLINFPGTPQPEQPSEAQEAELNEMIAEATTETEVEETPFVPSSELPTEQTNTATTVVEEPAPAPLVPDSPAPVSTDSAPPQISEWDAITNALLGSIQEIKPGASNFKMLVYGDPGCTKSSFAAGAPHNLIVDFEKGLQSALHSPVGIGEGTVALPFKSVRQIEAIVQRYQANDPAFAKWNILTLDTISDLHKRALQEVTERKWANAPSMRNRFVPETEDYIEVNEMLTRLVRSLRDIEKDIIVLAHAKTVEPKNRPAKTYPDFSESLANKLEAMMDVVAYVQMQPDDQGNMMPVFQVKTAEGIHAKTRLDLPDMIANPTWVQFKEKAIG